MVSRMCFHLSKIVILLDWLSCIMGQVGIISMKNPATSSLQLNQLITTSLVSLYLTLSFLGNAHLTLTSGKSIDKIRFPIML